MVRVRVRVMVRVRVRVRARVVPGAVVLQPREGDDGAARAAAALGDARLQRGELELLVCTAGS